jgi:ABC-type multidrug transport system ATPase subunit
VGYLQEAVDFPERARAHYLAALHGALAGRPRALDAGELEAYLDGFGLELTRKHLRASSKGMKQRLALALSMLDCGRLLILDEPNSGLDPVGIAMLRAKLDALKSGGATLLISTHRLAEVMHLADQVLVFHRGKVAGSSPMSEFPDFAALERYFLERVR